MSHLNTRSLKCFSTYNTSSTWDDGLNRGQWIAAQNGEWMGGFGYGGGMLHDAADLVRRVYYRLLHENLNVSHKSTRFTGILRTSTQHSHPALLLSQTTSCVPLGTISPYKRLPHASSCSRLLLAVLAPTTCPNKSVAHADTCSRLGASNLCNRGSSA